MFDIDQLFNILHKTYGSQGWWPLVSLHFSDNGSNPTKTGSINGYHPGDYSFPKSRNQVFEICLGAILTQNTSWPQVEKALLNLKKIGATTPNGLISSNVDEIKSAIKPAGYFNQKGDRLVLFAKYFKSIDGKNPPTRDELLSQKGIGPETADSILLYAFKQSEFVIDAYTKRIFSRLGMDKSLSITSKYDEFKSFFETNTKIKDQERVEMFQEFHALIVEHAKRFCKTKPECDICILNKECKRVI